MERRAQVRRAHNQNHDERTHDMTTITLQGTPFETVGALPEVGQKAPDFSIAGADLKDLTLADFAGQKLVLNIVPSVNTPVCAASARTFNERAAGLEGAKVITISEDLPFSLGGFCAAEGIEDVVMGSGFRSTFGKDYGVTVKDGPFGGLMSRAVVVLNADHEVVYTEHVPEIANEPDYDAALAALEGA
jgi:thiol peroxidase